MDYLVKAQATEQYVGLLTKKLFTARETEQEGNLWIGRKHVQNTYPGQGVITKYTEPRKPSQPASKQAPPTANLILKQRNWTDPSQKTSNAYRYMKGV